MGCAGLQLTTIKATQQKPSNVAVYFKVEDSSGTPLGGLTADRFRIYEDDQLVSQYESKQTILQSRGGGGALHPAPGRHEREHHRERHGRHARAGGRHLHRSRRAAAEGRHLRLRRQPGPHPIAPFTDQPGSAKAGVQVLATFKPKDPSTNLNGAVVRALDELDTALGKATQPLKFGTLVVFTDGTDRANRVPAADMQQHIKEKPFDVFAIGLGAEIQPDQLGNIGKSGTAMAADKNAVVKAFDEIGAKVDARTKSYYLLSYCSPSRAGKHEVRVEAVVKNSRTTASRSEACATSSTPRASPRAATRTPRRAST